MKTWIANPPRTRHWVAIASLALLAACGGGSDGGGTGTMRLALTDAPACGYDQVNVTVDRVRVHQSATAGDSAAQWQEIVLSPARRVNLLNLTNGVLEELGSTPLPAGTYSQLRLVLASNSGGAPLANSVVPTGGSETALDTPSAQQSGLKLQVHMTVAAGQIADYVIDFDACKSVVPRGNSGRFNLKPVVAVLPRVTTGLAVVGQLSNVSDSSATAVSLQQAGVVVRSTVPTAQGGFVLSPVPAGTYDLVVSAANRATMVLTGVPVSTSGVTTVSTSTSPIVLLSSGMRQVSGLVGTTGSPAIPDAIVAPWQTLLGTTIEWGARPVDADTGAYAFSLPTQPGLKATYAAPPAALLWTPDTTTAARYTVNAFVTGKPTQSAPVNLESADAVVNFSFAP
ncbi:DUF4382 domain-containing protein [Hydrogenophaga sp. OTU3427]|uniref:DUF4382 domain-containing protein n=1 Tax=Hydrogenophaga sp. OTU3427 TaxID=3043856 RepID=UPI00313BD812